MAINIDATMLTAYYQARYGGLASTTATGTSTVKTNPTPPWNSQSTAPQMSDLTRSVLAGRKFIDEGAAKLDVPAASQDYKRLFSLYQGLTALQGLAEQATATGTSATRKAELNTRFTAGMLEIGAYLDKQSFTAFQLAQGTAADKIQTTTGVKRQTDTYTTATLHSGSPTAEVAAFQGATVFSLTATKTPAVGPPTATIVDFDLSEMGATPRTMANVTIYMNDKLQTAGLMTRFSVLRTPGAERTAQAGGQTVSLGTDPDTYALQLKGVSTEVVSFSAPAAAPAVYIGETQGLTTGGAATADRLFKFQTDPASGATTAADGKIFAKTLGAEVDAIRASVTAPDGSLYVLAEVSGKTDGQTIKGVGDVVLQKYDSAGNLTYSRTLGAARDAAGYALTVSADGQKVAIAGSVTGALDLGDVGANATLSDSFVAVFDSEGQQVWSQRRGAAASDDRVDSIAFAADGSLYVTGTTGSAMPGATAVGGQDAYVQRFAPTAVGAAEPYASQFMVQYGSTGIDRSTGIAVSGSTLVVAGVENGNAVVRRYDLQPTGAPVLGAVRDLGPLNGGSVAGVTIAADGSVIVAGSTHNGALGVGQVTTAYTSGQSAFVAKLSADLGASGQERLTYYNGTGGDRTATALTVAGGQVYITGQAAVTPLPGQTTAFDGYAVGIDPDTGAVGWSQTFRGTDRMSAPTSIAVDVSGASVLDRLGLPRNTIDYTGSQQVTAVTSARAGDQFYVRSGTGTAKAVTIEANDTLQTLADKIGRATGFTAKVTIVKDGDYDRLKITPASARTPIEIEAGKGGRDALAALGLAEGLATTTADKNTKDSVKASYSLQLPSTLSLATDGQAKQSLAQLVSALSTMRSIYRDMTAPPAAKAGSTSQVSLYMQNQLANYQEALRRLTPV